MQKRKKTINKIYICRGLMITQNSLVTHLTKPHAWVDTTFKYVKEKKILWDTKNTVEIHCPGEILVQPTNFHLVYILLYSHACSMKYRATLPIHV